jgi:hypothetical protein
MDALTVKLIRTSFAVHSSACSMLDPAGVVNDHKSINPMSANKYILYMHESNNLEVSKIGTLYCFVCLSTLHNALLQKKIERCGPSKRGCTLFA